MFDDVFFLFIMLLSPRVALAAGPDAIQPYSDSTRSDLGVEESRTAREIVYSCLITLFLCLTYCIRPNITASNSSFWQKKLNIAFWILVAPELIISWACNQWYEGYKLAKKFRGRGWTVAHGQFVIMGGLMLHRDGRPSQVLSPEKFSTLLDAGCIEFPIITVDGIMTRSRAHPLITVAVILQTAWFIIQFIARLARGLSISQLELMTFSLVVMNGILLIPWWHKPLDTLDQIRIDLLHLPPPTPNPNVQNADDENLGIKLDFSREKSLGKQVKSVFKAETYPKLKSNSLLGRSLRFLLLLPLDFIEKLITDYGELFLRLDTEKVAPGALEVPIFYAPDTTDNLGSILFVMENILGSLFAASHICMWFASFPTPRDLLVWRISSVVTAGLPILFLGGISVLLGIYVISLFFTNRLTGIMLKVMQGVAIVALVLGFPALLAARMALIVEGFLSLRSLSEGMLEVVPWTNYIPHFS